MPGPRDAVRTLAVRAKQVLERLADRAELASCRSASDQGRESAAERN